MRKALVAGVVVVSALVVSAKSLAVTDGAGADSAAAAEMDRSWHAGWVTHPTAPLREPLVLHFRRALTLGAVPASYPVRVSADNRFVLFVNGQRVGDGPARGDLAHWRYERFDLAPLLHSRPDLVRHLGQVLANRQLRNAPKLETTRPADDEPRQSLVLQWIGRINAFFSLEAG